MVLFQKSNKGKPIIIAHITILIVGELIVDKYKSSVDDLYLGGNQLR